MSAETFVNQSEASAGRDIIGGDKHVNSALHNHFHPAPSGRATVVEQLLEKLGAEIASNSQTATVVEELLYFYEKKSHDGVNGLKAKLEKAGRSDEYDRAIEKKEKFVKLLEKWSMFSSAQDIFVFLLARADNEYHSKILPHISLIDRASFNAIVDNNIVEPVVSDCGASVFKINHGTAMGMFYWLAEQCFVRWHK